MTKKAKIHTWRVYHVDADGGLYFLSQAKARKVAKGYREAYGDPNLKARPVDIEYKNIPELVERLLNGERP